MGASPGTGSVVGLVIGGIAFKVTGKHHG